MAYWTNKRAVVIGASSGLGFAVADAFATHGARVALVARRQPVLEEAAQRLRGRGAHVLAVPADVTRAEDVRRLLTTAQSAWGGVDVVCHCAARSMRGSVLTTRPEEFRDLWETNFLSAVRCTQEFAPALQDSRGHLVLVGSLASKVATRYLGAYPASKFPLAALAQQLRLEVGEAFHVLLVCPGPIARDDEPNSGGRYTDHAGDIPATAHRPGGGAKLRALDPQQLAQQILRACEERRPEIVVPAKARLLFALSQLSPRLGDWLLSKFTS